MKLARRSVAVLVLFCLLANLFAVSAAAQTALEITKQVNIDPSLNAAIIGDGRLAFMIAQVLALTGTDLTVIGRHPEKLRLFRPFADVRSESDYLPLSDTSLPAEDCFETVIDASGSPSGFRLALRIVRKAGTIVLKSTYAGSSELSMSEIPVNEITVVGSRCGPFEPALRLPSRRPVSSLTSRSRHSSGLSPGKNLPPTPIHLP